MQQVENPSSGRIGAAVLGGIIGAVLVAALLIFAAPQLIGTRLVRAGLMADPQVLIDAGEALRDMQYAPIIAERRAEIETPFGTSWKGSSKPDVVLVEFYDYACPYCKASNPAIEKLIREDSGLRVVYRELPILGPSSVTAARLSLAASKAGRFAQFHDSLWEAGKPGPETMAAASAAAGIAPEPVDSIEIEAELRKNFQLAGQLGATGTPLFVIGDRVFNSAVSYDVLKKAIADAREKRS
ncbi:MAG TPA: DsbA family protein [Sphingomicrobium sp.]|nr:DsbA family protein [Sphingomicrobium sp.]